VSFFAKIKSNIVIFLRILISMVNSTAKKKMAKKMLLKKFIDSLNKSSRNHLMSPLMIKNSRNACLEKTNALSEII
jgi:hypothetical protein